MTKYQSEPTTVVELLQNMIRIRSVNPSMGGPLLSEKAIGDFLFDLATQWQLNAQRLACKDHADQILITVAASRSDRPWVLFDSHMDTVSVEGMTIDPFGGVIKNGRLLGRGACDTKGTGATMLWALRQYMQQPDRPNNIALLFGVDEEQGMTGIVSFIEHDLPNRGWCPAAAIVGEPTDFHPIVTHHGLLRWNLVTRGVAAHSSLPHEGRSAISAMVKVIAAMESNYIPTLDAEDELAGRAACSINVIRGGCAANVIPDFCEVEVDRRLTPDEDAQATLEVATHVLEELDVEVERHVHIQHPPLTKKHNGALIEQTREVLTDLKSPTMVLGVAFATHAAYFDAAKIPSVVIGPGDIHQAHTKNESIPIDHLERGVALYLKLMQSIDL